MKLFSQPEVKPSETPTITPTKPDTAPQDPSKIRIPKPSVDPQPKA